MQRLHQAQSSFTTFSCLLVASRLTLFGQLDPGLTIQPTNQTVVTGSDVVFIAAAMGTAPLVYQWQFLSNDIPGASQSSLTLTNVQASQAGTYRVVVTNDLGQVATSNALLTVIGPYTVGTLAGMGGTPGTNDGKGIAARFYFPAGIVVDPGGTVFVSEYGSHTIRRITPDGLVTTIAGLAGAIGWKIDRRKVGVLSQSQSAVDPALKVITLRKKIWNAALRGFAIGFSVSAALLALGFLTEDALYFFWGMLCKPLVAICNLLGYKWPTNANLPRGAMVTLGVASAVTNGLLMAVPYALLEWLRAFQFPYSKGVDSDKE